MTSQRVLRLVWPTALLAVFLFPVVRWSSISPSLTGLTPGTVQLVGQVFAAGAWLAGAWVAVRLVEWLLWDAIVAPRLGGAVPRLLKDVSATFLFLFAVGGFIGITLGGRSIVLP